MCSHPRVISLDRTKTDMLTYTILPSNTAGLIYSSKGPHRVVDTGSYMDGQRQTEKLRRPILNAPPLWGEVTITIAVFMVYNIYVNCLEPPAVVW